MIKIDTFTKTLFIWKELTKNVSIFVNVDQINNQKESILETCGKEQQKKLDDCKHQSCGRQHPIAPTELWTPARHSTKIFSCS